MPWLHLYPFVGLAKATDIEERVVTGDGQLGTINLSATRVTRHNRVHVV